MKGRLADNHLAETTIVDPPPVQAMNAKEKKAEPASSSSGKDGENSLALQPV